MKIEEIQAISVLNGLNQHDFTFIGGMRVSRHESTNFSFMNKMRVFSNKDKYWNSLVR